MTQYKLVALDMDGTLLNESGQISEGNMRAIREALDAGVTVSFSTGRGFPSAYPFAEQLGLLQTPMVTVNGGEVWKTPNELHLRRVMEAGLVRRLHELVSRYDVWYWAYSIDGIYNTERWIDDIDSTSWLKFGVHSEDDASRNEILNTIRSWGGMEITNSSPVNIEINPIGVNKAVGMQEMCKLLGIDMSQAIAVGDSLNDIAAIREAGLGVAMGNAQDAVKEAADYVTASNEEDGVAEVIRKFVLGQQA